MILLLLQRDNFTMKIAIINCFDTWQNRVDFVEEYFKKNNHSVTVITSDFKHREKTRIVNKKEGYVYINVPSYRTNVSVGRIYSHYIFAKRAFNYIENHCLKPDLLYVLIPPNFLSCFSARYKRRYNCKLILDVIDMWPESLIKSKVLIIFSKIWSYLRKTGIDAADTIVCECYLFKRKLQQNNNQNKFNVVYFCKKSNGVLPPKRLLDKDVIRFCWLGSVNNIIDIDKIVNLFDALRSYKKIELEIIGSGEKIEEFVARSEKVGCKVHLHGNVYDEQKKYEIMSKCHYALNIMKPTVSVGLTMKSIDYLENGLPLINSISGDTERFVEKYHIGFNYRDINTIINDLLKCEKENYDFMTMSSRQIWDNSLSYKANEDNLKHIWEVIDENNER